MSEQTHILVVEDDRQTLATHATLLKSAGYHVSRAASGEEALRRAREIRPDLILLDVTLPDVDGIEVCRRIKADRTFDQAPLILLAGVRTGGEERALRLDAGADGTLPHPIGGPELLTCIEAFLRVRRAEDERRAAEARYRDVFESAPIGIYRTTPDGKISMANPALIEMLGYESFEELARRDLESEGYHPDYPRADFKRRIEEGQMSSSEAAWQRQDGSTLFVREHARPVYDEQGRLVAYQGTVEDLTERVRRTRRLERLNTVLDAIGDVNQLVVREKDRRKLISGACARLVHSRGYSSAWIALLGEHGKPKAAAQAGLGDHLEEVIAALSQEGRDPCLVETLSQPGVWVGDGLGDCRIGDVYRGEELMAVRLEHAGKVHGVMTVSLPPAVEADEREKALFEEVASNITLALHNIELEEERRDAARALRESEKRYRVLFESTGTALAVFGDDRTIRVCNEKFADLAGLPREAIEGQMTWSDFVADRDLERMQRYHAQRTAGSGDPPTEYDFTFVDANGTTKEIYLQIGLMEETGERVASLTDVTLLKLAEEALRDSEERYRTLFESSPEAVVLLDLEGTVVACNPATEAIAGRPRREIVGMHFAKMELFPAEDAPRYASLFSRLLRGEHVEPVELRTRRADGKLRYLEAFPVPIIKGGQVQAIQVIARDVTERRRTEKALRQSDARNRAILNALPDLIFVQSRDGIYLDHHATDREALRLPPEEFLGKSVHETLPNALADTVLALIERALATGEIQLHEYQLPIAGQLRHFEARMVPYGEEKVLSVVREITERKEAQQALRASHERFLTILNSIDAHIYVADLETHEILFTNASMQDDFGGDLSGEICWDAFRGRSGPCPHCTNDVLVDEGGDPTGVHVWEGQNPITGRWYVNHDRAITWVDGRTVRLQIATDITESKLAEREIRERQRYLEAVLWAAPDAIVTLDPQNRVVDWNAGAERLFGYQRQDVVGRDIDPLIARGSILDEAVSFTQLVCGGETLYPTETVRYRRDGSPVHLILAGAPILVDDELVGLVVVYTDISERKEAEDALRQSEEKFRTLFNSAGDAIFIHDLAGRFLEVNREATRRLGYSRDELLHMSPGDLDGRGYAPLVPKRIEEIEEEGHLILETVHLTKDGTAIPTELSSRTIQYQGETAILSIARDITERKRMEEELRQQERLAALGQLAGGIAHDFNNILAAIILFAQMGLRKPDIAPETREALETILEESHRAADLIQQVLDFSRSAMMETEPVDLVALVDETMALLRRTIPENVRLTTELSPHPCIVQADPTRIHQALMNLALNAKDAMPDGGELRVQVERVLAEGEDESPLPDVHSGVWARLTVADTGTGLSQEAQDHLFEPFFTTKEEGEGTGLGLAQVYGIVKQHQGFIDVDTAEAEGTAFTILLPLVEEEQEADTKGRDEASPEGHHETILVVEDAERLRRAIAAGLESLGYRVITAANGRQALETVSEHDVDLVLTDVVMPHLGGEALLQALLEEHPTLRVIAMTGHVMDRGLEELRAAGFAEALPKPFSIEALNQIVRDVLRRQAND